MSIDWLVTNYEQSIEIYLYRGTRECRGKWYNFIRLVSMHGRSGYWMEFDEGGNWKQTGICTRDAWLVFLTWLAPLFPTLRVVTHSFCVTPMHELCARTRALFSLLSRFIRADAGKQRMHIQTHATNTLKVPPPTAVHPIASRFLSRAAPPYTQLADSCALSLTLALPRILVTHLPIISQSS